jgi:hypothetical protein
MIFWDFLLFLFTPEDSGVTAMSRGNRLQYPRFDNRLCGAVKICFWTGVTVLFWISLPLFLRIVTFV